GGPSRTNVIAPGAVIHVAPSTNSSDEGTVGVLKTAVVRSATQAKQNELLPHSAILKHDGRATPFVDDAVKLASSRCLNMHTGVARLPRIPPSGREIAAEVCNAFGLLDYRRRFARARARRISPHGTAISKRSCSSS